MSRDLPNVQGLSLSVVDGPRGGVNTPRPDPCHCPGHGATPPQAWPHIAYTVALYDGPGHGAREIWRGPYSMGVGHVKPAHLRIGAKIPGDADRWHRAESLAFTWARKPGARFVDPQLWADVAAALARAQGVRPKVHDVLSCLLSDGAAFFDAQSFPDWCADMGMNPDSITDRATFDLCVETGRVLTAALGADRVARLREVFQDY